jgi:hypothetical protein
MEALENLLEEAIGASDQGDKDKINGYNFRTVEHNKTNHRPN